MGDSFDIQKLLNNKLDRVGSKCWLGDHHIIRGVVMNPINHPHRGGERRISIEICCLFEFASSNIGLKFCHKYSGLNMLWLNRKIVWYGSKFSWNQIGKHKSSSMRG